MDGTMGMDTVFLMRSVERMLIIGAGALSAYLGYRLFLSAGRPRSTTPGADNGTLNADVPTVGKLVMTNVAPGVFFALFGTAMIITAALREVRHSQTDIEVQGAPGSAVAESTRAAIPALLETSGPVYSRPATTTTPVLPTEKKVAQAVEPDPPAAPAAKPGGRVPELDKGAVAPRETIRIVKTDTSCKEIDRRDREIKIGPRR